MADNYNLAQMVISTLLLVMAAAPAIHRITAKTTMSCWASCCALMSTAAVAMAQIATRAAAQPTASRRIIPLSTVRGGPVMRSGPPACATPGASVSTGSPATSGSGMLGRTVLKRSILRRPAVMAAKIMAGAVTRATAPITPPAASPLAATRHRSTFTTAMRATARSPAVMSTGAALIQT